MILALGMLTLLVVTWRFNIIFSNVFTFEIFQNNEFFLNREEIHHYGLNCVPPIFIC